MNNVAVAIMLLQSMIAGIKTNSEIPVQLSELEASGG